MKLMCDIKYEKRDFLENRVIEKRFFLNSREVRSILKELGLTLKERNHVLNKIKEYAGENWYTFNMDYEEHRFYVSSYGSYGL